MKLRKLLAHEQLRNDIIATAKAIGSTEGWKAVTMRRVAEKLEYKAPIIYEYFENKDALLRCIRKEAFASLFKSYAQVAQATTNPLEKLHQFGEIYLTMALEHKQLYKLMYGIDGNELIYDEIKQAKEEINALVKQILIEVLTPYKNPAQLADFNFDDAVDIYRCVLHGALVFAMTGGLSGNEQHTCALAHEGLRALTTSWIKGK